MKNPHLSLREWRTRATATIAVLAAFACVAVASLSPASSAANTSKKQLRIAYLSYAVANPYDAPMLAAAKAVAAGDNAKLVVFDANNDPTTQYSQFQDVLAAGKSAYNGIIVQPILGPALVKLVESAIAKGIPVGNLDQILGTNLSTDAKQVKGLAANVVFVPTSNGLNMGKETVAYCAHVQGECQIGYLYGVQGSSVDQALISGFNQAIAGHSNIKIVATGQDLYSTQGGLTATQNMLQANPNLNVVVGADQALDGAREAFQAAGVTKATTIGTGGSAIGLQAVKAGTEYASVMQLPASEGRLATQDLLRAIRTGKNQPSRAPASKLPDNGVATKATVSKFTAEWSG